MRLVGLPKLRRSGLHWTTRRNVGGAKGTLVFETHRIPPFPATYGTTVAIEPGAIAEAPQRVIFLAAERLVRNAQDVDRLLGRRGLDWRTFRLTYVPPTSTSPDTLMTWRAERA